MIIAIGFALFGMAVKYLPIFPKEAAMDELASESELLEATPVLEHAGD
jgi:hypothetical protein